MLRTNLGGSGGRLLRVLLVVGRVVRVRVGVGRVLGGSSGLQNRVRRDTRGCSEATRLTAAATTFLVVVAAPTTASLADVAVETTAFLTATAAALTGASSSSEELSSELSSLDSALACSDPRQSRPAQQLPNDEKDARP